MNGTDVRKVLVTWADGEWREPVKHSLSGPEFDGVEVVFSDDREQALREIADAEVLYAGTVDEELVAAARRLRWIQLARGGLRDPLPPALVDSSVVVTSLKELFAAPGAEFALMAMLMISRRMTATVGREPLAQSAASLDLVPVDLAGATVGILGLGNIGRRTAELSRAFGMRVLGCSRTAPHEGVVDEFFALEELPAMLGRADYVVLAVPATPKTLGLVGPEFLDAMKDEAWLVDVSARPQLLDYPALERALEKERIAGVMLQPVGQHHEGMPAEDSDFWARPDVVVSSCRSISAQQMDQTLALFPDNFRRLLAGEPLRGLVNKAEGY